MIIADIKLLNKLQSESDIKTVEQIQEKFQERNIALMQMLKSNPVPDHLKDADKDTGVLRILAPFDIYAVLSVGIYHAHETMNMSVLNNSLFTYNRLKFYPGKLNQSGYDHCIYFENAIESFAGNDIAHIRKMFLPELGLSTNGHRFLVTGTNLIMALFWNNADWKEESLNAALKFLTRKNGRSDDLCVLYLLSIMDLDMAKASEYLSELCQLYKKNGFVHNFRNPFLKVFGAFIHGLYNLAHHFLPADKFEQLIQPDHTVFWKEFASYNKNTGFTPGKPFITFEGDIAGLNKIYI